MHKEQHDAGLPQVAERPVPRWVKVMWVLGILWVIAYIVGGLSHTPTTW